MPAYCRRAEYEENSSPVLEGYLQFLYASSLFLQKYKARLALEMGFVSNLILKIFEDRKKPLPHICENGSKAL